MFFCLLGFGSRVLEIQHHGINGRIKKITFDAIRWAGRTHLHRMTSFQEVQAALAPVRSLLPVGGNLARRQPDVEILGMLLSDLPVTAAAFEGMRKANDWVSMAVGVVAVGPPGFSSVPYSSTKKPGEKEDETKRLYTLDDTGRTVFSTFEKMKNNKDRGKRAPTMEVVRPEGESLTVDATAILEPGVCLSTFLREDIFTGPSGFVVRDEEDTLEVLPAGTLVYMALGTKNVEQALKGQMLKFKKIKRCANSSEALSTSYNFLPTDPAKFKQVSQESVEKYPSIAKMVNVSTRNGMLGGVCNVNAYASYNDQKNEIVLSEVCFGQSEPIEVVFEESTLLKNHCFSDPHRMVRWINIAISRKAVGVLVLSKSSYSEEGDSLSYVGAAMNIDINQVLAMPDIFSMNNESDTRAFKSAYLINDVFVWSPENALMSNQEKERHIVFALRMKKSILQEPWNESEASLFLTDGCKGGFNALSVYAVEKIPTALSNNTDEWHVLARLIAEPQKLASEDIDIPFSKKMVLSVQIHTQNRGTTVSKRKRPDMCVEDEKDNVQDYLEV